jgi:ParB-like protein
MSRPSAYALAFMNISAVAKNAKNLDSTPRDDESAHYTKRLNAWYEQGQQLATQGNSTVWETADWLLEARTFGSREDWCYKEAAAILSLSVGCCRNYACVAKAFSAERRIVTSEVTFGHHRVVAALPDAEQERLLGATAANRWSVGELRREVRKASGIPRPRKQSLSSTQQRIQKWWDALQRLASESQITEALVGLQLVPPTHRPQVAVCLREMGARLIALAQQVETPPPTTEPQVQEKEMMTA